MSIFRIRRREGRQAANDFDEDEARPAQRQKSKFFSKMWNHGRGAVPFAAKVGTATVGALIVADAIKYNVTDKKLSRWECVGRALMDAYKIFGHVADWFATHPGMVVAGVAIYNVIKTVKRLKNYTGTAAQKIGIGVCEVPQKIISVAFWAGAIEFALKTISDNALKYAYISDSIKNIVESARKAFHEMYPTVAKMAMWTVDHWGATIAIASVSAIMLYIKHKIKENMHQQAEEMRKRYNENYLHQRDLEALELENELLEQRRREEEGNGFTTVN